MCIINIQKIKYKKVCEFETFISILCLIQRNTEEENCSRFYLYPVYNIITTTLPYPFHLFFFRQQFSSVIYCNYLINGLFNVYIKNK